MTPPVFTKAGGPSKLGPFSVKVVVTGRELEVKLLANPTGPASKGSETGGLPPK